MPLRFRNIMLSFVILVVILSVYLWIRIDSIPSDFSIIPGWHTTVLPAAIYIAMMLLVCLIVAGALYVIGRFTFRRLSKVISDKHS